MSGQVVIDASLAVAWVVEEDAMAGALAPLEAWENQRVRRLAPCWFACEVGAALYLRDAAARSRGQ